MARLPTFLALLAATAAVTLACHSNCRFYFCDSERIVKLGRDSDVSLTSSICNSDGIRVGVIGRTGEALLQEIINGDNIYTPISKWNPKGLKQNFSPSFLKTYTIRVAKYRYVDGKRVKYYEFYSGVGRERYQQNQKSVLENRCFFLPILSWQVLDNNKNVVSNQNKPYKVGGTNCMSFKTTLY